MRAHAASRASALVYVLILVATAASWMIAPLLPTVQHRYGLDAPAVAWILTLPSLAMLASATPLGILGDRIGNRRVTVAAGMVIALSVLAQGSPSLTALIVAQFGFGVGNAALFTAGPAWLVGMRATGSSRRLAASATASAVGGAIGPTLSGTLASHFGFAAPFAVAGTLTTVVTGLLVAAPKPPRTKPGCLAGTAARPSAPRRNASKRWRFGKAMFATLRRPAVLAGAATLALAGGVGSLLQLLVPVQLHSSGHSAQQIGFVLSAGWLVYIGASAICVRVGPHIVSFRTNAWLAALLAVALVPALIGSDVAWVVAAVVMSALPRGAIGTVAYALATDVRDPDGPSRGAVIGVLNSLWAGAMVLVPLIGGSVSATAGPRWAYAAAAAAIAAIAVLLHQGATRQHRRAGHASPLEGITTAGGSSAVLLEGEDGRGHGREAVGAVAGSAEDPPGLESSEGPLDGAAEPDARG